jgi:hypothetical protein
VRAFKQQHEEKMKIKPEINMTAGWGFFFFFAGFSHPVHIFHFSSCCSVAPLLFWHEINGQSIKIGNYFFTFTSIGI